MWIFACRYLKVSLKQINMASWLLKWHVTNSLKQKKKYDLATCYILISWQVLNTYKLLEVLNTYQILSRKIGTAEKKSTLTHQYRF